MSSSPSPSSEITVPYLSCSEEDWKNRFRSESTGRRNLVGAFKGKTFVLYYICHSISCNRYRESEDKMLALKQTIKDISKAKKYINNIFICLLQNSIKHKV